MVKITLANVEHVAHDLAKRLMDWNEPIPPFVSRYPHKLESCLATPFQTYNRKPLYRTLVDRAAILFYLMVKNHPFKNGNKRIAVTTLLSFLSLNGKWLTVNPHELYSFAMFVAKSPPKYQKDIVIIIKKFIKTNMTQF
jgi:death-on-curing family protein